MKPSILHIVDSFEPGGTERQAVQLVRLLHAHARYDVYLACLQNRGLLRAEAESLGLEISEYPLSSFYDRNFLVQLRRLVRFLKEHEIKVIHTHDFYTNIFGMTAAALARVPARIASKRETHGFRTSLQKRVERGAYRFADVVLANAEAVRRQLISEGVRAEKVVTLYNGLDMERVTPQNGMQLDEKLALFGLPQAEGKRRLVTIVANLQHPVKDYPTFLRAAARVHEAVPEAAFVVAGQGELLDELRALVERLGLERDVFFIGRCQRVADLLSVSDICVLSSRAEGFSNSILEYMAAARPVVVTDVGGAREAVTEGATGHLVAAGDDEAMAARIIALLNEPETARAMGERGRRVVVEKFSSEAQLERTLNLYDRLLAVAEPALPRSIESVGSERA